jgi:hypothetical protein
MMIEEEGGHPYYDLTDDDMREILRVAGDKADLIDWSKVRSTIRNREGYPVAVAEDTAQPGHDKTETVLSDVEHHADEAAQDDHGADDSANAAAAVANNRGDDNAKSIEVPSRAQGEDDAKSDAPDPDTAKADITKADTPKADEAKPDVTKPDLAPAARKPRQDADEAVDRSPPPVKKAPSKASSKTAPKAVAKTASKKPSKSSSSKTAKAKEPAPEPAPERIPTYN